MAKTNTIISIKEGQKIKHVNYIIHVYVLKFDSSKILNLLIDQVYLTYIYYKKFEEKFTYSNIINSKL